MKKEKQTNKTELSLGRLNSIIGSLNKTSLTLLVGIYVCLLTLVLSLVGRNISYNYEPPWEHIFYDEEINPQIGIAAVYGESKENPVKRYSVSVKITPREEKEIISSFRMFANIKAKPDSDKIEKTQYFTEHKSTTPSRSVAHNYYINNETEGRHPADFYIRIAHKKEANDSDKISTFKEKIFLLPTKKDKEEMNLWLNANKDKGATEIKDCFGNKKGEMNLSAHNDPVLENTSVNIRIKVTDKEVKKYHIDMQTWVVTKSGDYLPFVGVYSMTGSEKRYSNNSIHIENIKPEYIAGKLTYRDAEDAGEETCYFKQSLEVLKRIEGAEDPGEMPSREENRKPLYICLIVAGCILISGCLVLCVYFYETRKAKKTKQESVEKQNKDKGKKKTS